jgi:peptide/nickel transport system substrate-binding protein
MRTNGPVRVLAALAVTALTAVACTGTTKTPSGSTGVSGSGAAQNATFTYDTYTQVMVGWDPSTSYSNEILAMSNMYETLTRYDSATQTVQPLLATAWKSSHGGTSWSFTLQQGVTFHTGRPMTSADVKASIERTIKLNQGAAYIWGAVKSIQTPDPSTVTFTLKYPAPLDLIASADYAAYIYDTKASGSEDLGKWFESGHEAGTGPYMLDSWNKGQEVELRLKAYPDYWGGWDGPHYTNYVFRVVPSATTSAQLLRAGQVSFADRLTPQLWASFQNQQGYSTPSSPSWQTLLAMLNTASGPLTDQRVRQAISYAIDWQGMMAALHGGATLLSGVIPPGLWGHTDGLEPVTDVQKATDLLRQAGYGPGGKEMSLTLTYTQGDSDEQLVAGLMKSDLAKQNITLDVRGLAWPTQWAKAKSSDLSQRQDILLFYWWPDYADPYSWFINLFHTENPPYFNLSYYSNPTLDKQMQQAELLAASNRDQSIQLYKQMQDTVYQQLPAISAYTQQYQRVMLSSVQGYVDNPAYPNVVFAYDLHPGS